MANISSIKRFEELTLRAKRCEICREHLPPPGPRPLFQVSPFSKILIIGQAPGIRAATSGIPWDDKSGKRLRDWLGISNETFYDPNEVALMPMGFCYPGTNGKGDLPPRPECAPAWHEALIAEMPNIRLRILIGKYALARYLPSSGGVNLTETVRSWKQHLAERNLPLIHPSPRNRFWLKQNPWFEAEMLPEVRIAVEHHLSEDHPSE